MPIDLLITAGLGIAALIANIVDWLIRGGHFLSWPSGALENAVDLLMIEGIPVLLMLTVLGVVAAGIGFSIIFVISTFPDLYSIWRRRQQTPAAAEG